MLCYDDSLPYLVGREGNAVTDRQVKQELPRVIHGETDALHSCINWKGLSYPSITFAVSCICLKLTNCGFSH